MRATLAAIALALTLGMSPQAADAKETHKHTNHCRHSIKVEKRLLARASSYRAICSRGDLNASYSSRSAAVKAAKAHQRSTGHQTSVRKQ